MRSYLQRAFHHRLLEPAGEGGDPGGGGGGGGGENKDPPKYVTADEIGNVVNSAVVAQFKRMMPTAIKEGFEALKLGETLTELVKKAVPPPKEDPPQKDQPPKPDPQIAALQAQLQELTKKAEVAEKAREAAEKKSRDDSGRSLLRAALQDKVRPEAVDIVTKLLFDAERRVGWDENGNALLTVRRAPAVGMAEEDTPMPLADGVGHYLKTEDAKIFLPAPSSSGGGSKGPSPRPLARGADGLPVYDGPAKTEQEQFRRVDEKTTALLKRINSGQ